MLLPLPFLSIPPFLPPSLSFVQQPPKMEASSPPTHVIPRDCRRRRDHRVTEPAMSFRPPPSFRPPLLSLGWIELRLGNQCIGNGNEYQSALRLSLSLRPSGIHSDPMLSPSLAKINGGELGVESSPLGSLDSPLRAQSENAAECGRQQFSNGLPPSLLPEPVTFTSVHAADFRRSMGLIPSPIFPSSHPRSAFQRRGGKMPRF